MMWIIRAGKDSLYYDKYIENLKVYIPWDGYKVDFSSVESRTDFKNIVEKEKGTDNRASVSNWAGQLYTFVREIKPGDYVLVPSKGSHTYCLATVTGDYFFDIDEADNLFHSRKIKIIEKNIPRNIFTQSVVYALGAFRTIFKAKHEDEILKSIHKWRGTDENTI